MSADNFLYLDKRDELFTAEMRFMSYPNNRGNIITSSYSPIEVAKWADRYEDEDENGYAAYLEYGTVYSDAFRDALVSALDEQRIEEAFKVFVNHGYRIEEARALAKLIVAELFGDEE